ncbi:Glucan 4-alpha-glucosidase-like protein [Pleurostoma richardsiae]|uniref:Glucan 4-alpha-glucosidase-like protein n=1 Tax=Pleurostoma richardsiae TaxID=41990 RepID=A0AA38S026_9PEZI|nr:Glucan 4-alpha-glucosidase-like protein [Pleurostoma richardsiae]
MYPQNTRVARTLSVATSSTAPVSESSFPGPRGPTHPYAMYAQNPVLGSDTVPAPAPNIPVGFPGIPDQYQRRIGPDGEDVADIIGPDGHTEQLPPYTRYPDEAYALKVREMEQPTVTPVAASPIPGAGGIGLATRNPEFESTDDLATPRSRYSTRSFASDASQHEINVAAAGDSEKAPEKKWKERAKRRAFGIVPYWALCLVVFAILIMGIVLGGVIGTFFGKQKRPHSSASSQPDTEPTVTVTYDATPIPTPADLRELPTGTYSLPLGLNKSPNTCFNDTTLSQAWSCNIVFGSAMMTMSLSRNAPQLGKPSNYDISIACNESLTIADGVYSYGAQPPLIPQPMPMELVNDTQDASRGPAWFRMLPYNKTVVLPASLLAVTASATPTAGSKARGYGIFPGPDDFKRKSIAQTGDTPWVCVWPDTFLEVFIYPSQNSSYNLIASSSAGASSTTPAPTQSTPPPATSTSSSPSSTSYSYDPSYTMPPAAYPRVIKVEERRMDFAPAPTCTQVEILPNGATRPIVDEDGDPIEIIIDEIEPSQVSKARYEARDILAASIFARDGPEMSNCGCMWYLT